MKKLKLNLDDIRVESFATSPTEERRGTVFGQDPTHTEPECFATDPYCNDTSRCYTDGGTCYHTCMCANDSEPGWASCGTTCQVPTCEPGGCGTTV